jgi:hypothetical protein
MIQGETYIQCSPIPSFHILLGSNSGWGCKGVEVERAAQRRRDGTDGVALRTARQSGHGESNALICRTMTLLVVELYIELYLIV